MWAARRLGALGQRGDPDAGRLVGQRDEVLAPHDGLDLDQALAVEARRWLGVAGDLLALELAARRRGNRPSRRSPWRPRRAARAPASRPRSRRTPRAPARASSAGGMSTPDLVQREGVHLGRQLVIGCARAAAARARRTRRRPRPAPRKAANASCQPARPDSRRVRRCRRAAPGRAAARCGSRSSYGPAAPARRAARASRARPRPPAARPRPRARRSGAAGPAPGACARAGSARRAARAGP